MGLTATEAFANLTFSGVKQLEGYGIFLTLLIYNFRQALAFGNSFCSVFYNRFVNFSRDCRSSSNVHIKFVSLLAHFR